MGSRIQLITFAFEFPSLSCALDLKARGSTLPLS